MSNCFSGLANAIWTYAYFNLWIPMLVVYDHKDDAWYLIKGPAKKMKAPPYPTRPRIHEDLDRAYSNFGVLAFVSIGGLLFSIFSFLYSLR
jgi:hypothetical protein